ncbi:hypothetical protein BAUCODRAFT_422778 [Baudoinia panamericana UAMH 10762]|uniref:Uncharacterized protein n=1 Tax=Baudoinia panamericana (strain UAMH 10762) TaxID=717646 RepID=M2NGC6_BAUPA|nr:uncharacterized protein BAUCODRAFT_422778 [Baudoinia panamericana UAMH 10762]EMC98359.1 hypothetical protein BAUCODRAFT_422778 [Baudoinia panamericana UAMH 10762]
MATSEAPPQQQAAGLSRWVPSLPTIDLNALNPFATTSDPSKHTADANASQQAPDQSAAVSANRRSFLSTLSILGSTQTPAALATSRDPSPTPSSAMFAEPETRSTSEDGESREGSITDSNKRSKKKCSRSKTCFSVCHPAPTNTVKQRLHRRPRSLLQLHKLCPSARPKPAFEAIPAANFNPRLTKAITRVFKAKHGLCPNDLVVLKAENYAVVDDDEDEGQEEQDVIGLICKGRKQDEAAAKEGKAKICMASGAEWEAYPLVSGGYEFFTTDEHGLGLTVRWVPKKVKDRDGTKTMREGSKRFNFSTISPTSRRHPVIACLSKTALEINDSYKMPDAAAATPLSTPKQAGRSALAEAMEDETVGKEQFETDDALREIITMTAIWVTFKEGWSPSFKYDDPPSAAQRVASVMSASPSKSVASPLTTPPASPAPTQAPLEKRGSMKSMTSTILRKSSLRNKSNRASQISVPEEDESNIGLSHLENVKSNRSRADSTSTVLVHRAASNRRKNNTNQQATWRPDLLSAQQHNVIRETSRENVNSAHPASTVQQQPDSVWDSPSPTPHQRRRTSVVAERLSPPAPTGMGMESDDETENDGPAAETETETSPAAQPKLGAKAGSTNTNTRQKGKKRGWRKLFCGIGTH